MSNLTTSTDYFNNLQAEYDMFTFTVKTNSANQITQVEVLANNWKVNIDYNFPLNQYCYTAYNIEEDDLITIGTYDDFDEAIEELYFLLGEEA